jgi:hypothetical protein
VNKCQFIIGKGYSALERGESRSGKWSADVDFAEISGILDLETGNIRRPFPAAALPSFQGVPFEIPPHKK